jgi:tRNA modification GTPase
MSRDLDRLLLDGAARLDDVIVAVSTPPGRGAIGTVRLSGSRAGVDGVLARVLSARLRARLIDRRVALGTLRAPDGGEAIDQGLFVRFAGPDSYTGEDVVEFDLHGSPVLLEAAVRALCDAGARPAGPGEFTRRAVRSGRMGLLEAEAVDALVRSESLDAARLARRHLGGELTDRLEAWRERLLQHAAGLEAAVDFPEDVPTDVAPLASLLALREELARLADSFDAGRRLVEGARVVLTGPVNAGKSTLFNGLLGHGRAIVSEIPGTTRDVVSEAVHWSGRHVRLEDTAGLRESTDPVEAEGIARTAAAVARADVEVAVRDGRELTGLPPEGSAVAVATRADLLDGPRRAALEVDGWLLFGAPAGAGLEGVRAAIVAAGSTGSGPGDLLIHTARQHEAIGRAVAALDEGLTAGADEPVLAALAIRAAGRALEELTGRWTDEAVMDALFERFCVGK